MALTGPILLIEDQENDIEVIKAALIDLGIRNGVVAYTTAEDALNYLNVTSDQPFVILSDIRMPGMNGLEFRKVINTTPFLRRKAIPFVFLTAYVTPQIVNEAYDLDVQGFYRKENNYEALKEQLLSICIYWQRCLHPNRPGMRD